MSGRGRAAYRAIYLSSTTKFCTTLHAFGAQVAPRYHIAPWQKDPWAVQKHKWRVAKARRQGRWALAPSPLAGVRSPDWPDPALLGEAELAQVAARAQAEKLQDFEFWQQLAEKTFKLRDVMSAGDLATILDALLTADHRHLLLMKTLARELVDDADKLQMVEVAAVANAYARFSCLSEPLVEALSARATELMQAHLRDPDPEFDPQSVAVLARPRGGGGGGQGAGGPSQVDAFTFAALSELIVCFAAQGRALTPAPGFWEAAAAKAPGSRMASLCPALRALPVQQAPSSALRDALVAEILAGLQDVPLAPAAEPLGAALGLWGAPAGAAPRAPAFAHEPPPPQLMPDVARRGQGRSQPPPPAIAAGGGGRHAVEDWGEVAVIEEPLEPPATIVEATASAAEQPAAGPRRREALRRARWYRAANRGPARAARPEYAAFDPSEALARGRRGGLVADAVAGLGGLWRQDGGAPRAPPAPGGGTAGRSPAELELELVAAAAPVLRSSSQGLSAEQLVDCCEVYAQLAEREAPGGGVGAHAEVVRDLLQEAVRKLSNFSPDGLRRLHAAALQAGSLDPYLDWARQRRFPKALRQELRAGGGAPAAAAAPP
ncbi:unnamed protein product [Prorocentrum cordatum]|uniref:Uncharacterized protein n=1 Tax=Prorocentrum cordatum TaxID=2364126 RepID=A0ABN9VSN4_9DINO|nr:unnamed protein product [Polarella glacialis]